VSIAGTLTDAATVVMLADRISDHMRLTADGSETRKFKPRIEIRHEKVRSWWKDMRINDNISCARRVNRGKSYLVVNFSGSLIVRVREGCS
jgi:hypothetical protein